MSNKKQSLTDKTVEVKYNSVNDYNKNIYFLESKCKKKQTLKCKNNCKFFKGDNAKKKIIKCAVLNNK